ncbi:MAG: HAD family hydrolase [Thermomicrobiales bacterium]
MSIDPDSGNATSPRIFSRRRALGGMAGAAFALALRRELGRALTAPPVASPDGDPLPSWNEGAAKDAILAFVAAATDDANPGFVPPAARIATFDQDGTLWVEHPIYTQGAFAFARVAALAPEHPEWKTLEPFATILARDEAKMAAFSEQDLAQIVAATHAGMSVDEFLATVAAWLATAKHPRFNRLYTDLIYQPMLEVMALLRANGFRTFIVSGGGQEFIRAYAEPVYGIPPEQVIGTTFETKYQVQPSGTPVLIKEAKPQLNDNYGGKAENINLMIGRRPVAAFGNSTGDQQMLEWTDAGERARLMMLVYHDDAEREYAYGPAGGLSNTSIGTFTDALMTEANDRGWSVIGMKRDWNAIFPPD